MGVEIFFFFAREAVGVVFPPDVRLLPLIRKRVFVACGSFKPFFQCFSRFALPFFCSDVNTHPFFLLRIY